MRYTHLTALTLLLSATGSLGQTTEENEELSAMLENFAASMECFQTCLLPAPVSSCGATDLTCICPIMRNYVPTAQKCATSNANCAPTSGAVIQQLVDLGCSDSGSAFDWSDIFQFGSNPATTSSDAVVSQPGTTTGRSNTIPAGTTPETTRVGTAPGSTGAGAGAETTTLGTTIANDGTTTSNVEIPGESETPATTSAGGAGDASSLTLGKLVFAAGFLPLLF